MKSSRISPRLTFVLAAAAIAAGCSLVNSLDEVAQPRETGYAAAPKVDVPLVEGGSDAAVVVDAEAGSVSDHSVIVVGGDDLGDGSAASSPVLAVLDAMNGRELGTREKMYVAAIVYDAPRDLWYIFEAPSYFIPSASDVVKLHIRKLDIKTGAWTELSNSAVAPLVYYDGVVATNSRLTFVAHPTEAGGSFRLITLDTSNPALPSTLDERNLVALPLGLMATRSGGGPGGQVTTANVGSTNATIDGGINECADAGAQSCAVKLRRFLLPNNGGVQELGSFIYGAMSSFGIMGYGSVVCGGGPDELLVLPRNGAGPHEVHLIDYQSMAGPPMPITFAMNANATRLRRVAVDNSRRVVFVVEANTDTGLYAVPLTGGGTVAKVGLRHSGQSVYFDPGSQTVFAPFNQGNGNTFSAFRVSGDKTAPALQERVAGGTDWDPPKDLRPILLGIREPASYTCP